MPASASSRKRRRSSSSREERKSSSSSRSKRKREKERTKKSKSKEKKKKKEKKEKKKKSSSSSASVAGKIPPSNFSTISSDDYYKRNSEFRAWLARAKGKYFSDLSASKQRRYFDQFVEQWNHFLLSPEFYEGIESESMRTAHAWAFAKKMSDEDRLKLDSLADSVRRSSSRVQPISIRPRSTEQVSERKPGVTARKQSVRPSVAERRAQHANYISRRREDLEDLVPRERDRPHEKRKMIGAKLHAASREAESARVACEVRDADIYGSNEGARAALQRREQRRKEKSASKARNIAQRAQAAENAEKKRMELFCAQMGIQPGQRITIAPRK